MGNISSTQSSTDKDFKNFYEIIDYIATYYILTSDFNSLRKLTDKEYCDKLVILTSDIIKKYFTDLEVTYLAQRIKDGIEVNELTKDNIIFLNKEQLEDLDIQNDYQKSIRKKRVCLGIAKFYIKIAHLFAAIVMTINPIYSYKDENGNVIKVNLYDKDKIPKNVNRKVNKLNICDNRIKSLLPKEDLNEEENDYAEINPKLCSINIDENGNTKSLNNEPGIPELMQLYLDDEYDYSTGTFLGMSEKTKKQFNNDLKLFYNIFTGNENVPDNIKNFSDIKLKDYNQKVGCQGDDPLFKKKYKISKNDKLFIEYAKNIKNMISSASSKQKELLNIINDIFSYVKDPYSGKKKIRINPKLTDEILQNDIEKTRNIIIQLYLKCEQDYVNGIKIYEAIIESKILETTQNQIKNLENEALNIIKESNKTIKIQQTKTPSSSVIGPAFLESNASEEVKPEITTVQEVKPEVSTIEEVKPEVTNIEEVKPEVTNIEEVKPEGSTVQELKPEGTTVEEVKPEGTTVEEVKPEGTTVQEVKPEGSTVQEVKPEGTTVQEVKPEDTTIQEVKPEVTTVEEVKPEENIKIT